MSRTAKLQLVGMRQNDGYALCIRYSDVLTFVSFPVCVTAVEWKLKWNGMFPLGSKTALFPLNGNKESWQ